MDDDQHARAVAGWLERGAATCRRLAAQHAQLSEHVARSESAGKARTDADLIRATKPGPGVPICVEVVDLRAGIAADARRYADLVRGTLRAGRETVGTTAGRLCLIADNLVDLNAADPALTDELLDVMWGHARQAAQIVEPQMRPRPFRVAEPCPGCGAFSLWLDPDPRAWRIGCGMPACRRVWGVSEPVLAEGGIETAEAGARDAKN